ncbi:hypothetical protein FHR70_000741 [Microvirga lupini]|uniref:Uncharacterized protein n=1 Tax=Microvirga lupini TaxID=420324 RepID=A0A7W4VJ30_9HYPH|nr:hypothetical protein [Microvirga lupini]MBB3017701.1 hypothetical protein [Microvirga lupini]
MSTGKFDELLAQLNAEQEEQSTLAKALPADGGEDDKAIQTASAEGAEGENTNPEDEGEEGKQPLAKSMTTAEGEELEIVDAGELIKSLHDLTGRTTVVEETLTKGLEAALGLIKGQGDMIKSLQGQISKLGGQGAGRKTVLAVHERAAPAAETLAKSQAEEGMTKEQFLAKSEAAWQANKITGIEFSAVDAALRTGGKLDPSLIQRIVQ